MAGLQERDSGGPKKRPPVRIVGLLEAGIWLAVLYIILVPTVGTYYLNAWALARVEPSTAPGRYTAGNHRASVAE